MNTAWDLFTASTGGGGFVPHSCTPCSLSPARSSIFNKKKTMSVYRLLVDVFAMSNHHI